LDEPTLPYTPDSFPSVKRFARHMIQGGRLTLAPIRDAVWTPEGHADIGGQKIISCILFRSGCWQVELLVYHPGASAPLHRHNYCESADILLNGNLAGIVGNLPFKEPKGDNLALNITQIPIGAWHGGHTTQGLIALSFQKWIGVEPTFIANDWELHHGD
jgi:hypothetical protein